MPNMVILPDLIVRSMDCGRIELRMAQGGWHRLICIFATESPIRPGN